MTDISKRTKEKFRKNVTLSKVKQAEVKAYLMSDGDGVVLPTADEKAALSGTGTPSASNKYVTEDTLTTTIGDIETALTEILS